LTLAVQPFEITVVDRILGKAGVKQMANLYLNQQNILQKQAADLSQELDVVKERLVETQRPVISNLITRGQYKEFRNPYLIENLFREGRENSTLRHCVDVITDGLTKEGMDIDPQFKYRCMDCNRFFNKEIESCENCGSTNLMKPDLDEKKPFEDWFKNMNFNNQSLEKLTHIWAEDVEITDEVYIVYIYNYEMNEMLGSLDLSLLEVIRGNPGVFELIFDETGMPGEGPHRKFFCPIHRTTTGDEATLCPNCKNEGHENPLVQAWFRSWNSTNYPTETPRQQVIRGEWNYYAPWEVFHTSKYSPSMAYGFPLPITLWKELRLLDHMLEYMLFFYVEGRYPRGVLAIVSDNPKDVYNKAAEWKEKHKEDPQYVPTVAVSSSSGRGKVEWIPLADSVKEMEWRDVREEVNNRIAAAYRLSKSYMNDPDAGAGLGNQSLDIALTQEGMDMGQRLFNEEIYPDIIHHIAADLSDLDLTERWACVLNKNKTSDTRRQIQLLNEYADFAQKMSGLGFKVTFDSEALPPDCPFTISDEPDEGLDFMDPNMWGPDSRTPGPEVPEEAGDESQASEEEIL